MKIKKTFIIAEAGVNHNGNLEMAKKLIEVAARIGADAVKFQMFRAEKLVSKIANKARYQLKTTDVEESQQDMIRRLELSQEAFRELFNYAKEFNLIFLTSPFDIESVDFLDNLGISAFKIPSGEITNKPLLEHIASKQKPIILSTGMSTLHEVEQAVHWIQSVAKVDMTLLHCVTEYPAPTNQINLRAMDTLREKFECPVGYSDHTEGIQIVAAAVARGATVIEKHLTLDRNLPGPDHKASSDPQHFEEMIRNIRQIEMALGNGIKRPVPCEFKNIEVARKSVVASYDLKLGHTITKDDIAIKRPGTGIAPEMADQLIGKQIRKKIAADEVLTWDHF